MESVFRLTVWLHEDPGTKWFLNWDSMVLHWDSWFFTRWIPGLTITICNKITANRVKPAKVPLFCYNVNYIYQLLGEGGGEGGTQGNSRKRCAAEDFTPWPCLRQKLLISLPCLRQETLLSDPDAQLWRCSIVKLYTLLKTQDL